MVDLDNWLVGNPLVIPKYEAKIESVLDSQGTGFTKTPFKAESIVSENINSKE